MKQLWAPWRMEFIEGPKGPGCVFCESLKGEDDRKALVLWRGKHAFVMMNKFPYVNGHLLILPNRHTAELGEVDAATSAEILQIMARSTAILKNQIKCEGVNAGLNLGKPAGAGILDHLHFHLVPRWVGDTNFMPVIFDTRHMPEYLETTYDRLKPSFDKLTSSPL